MAGPRDDVVIGIRVELEQARKALRMARKDIAKFGKDSTLHLKSMAVGQDLVAKASGKLSKEMNRGKMEFQGWAMSIMFFGMALKRTFDMIWKSSTKTFNDVMSSVEGNVTSFQMLEGALKYLGFTAGAALEPIAMFLIPIIDKLSQWITENEKLFATIVIGAGILGTFFTILGSGVLAAAGFIQAWGLIAGAFSSSGVVIGATTVAFGTIATVLGVVTAAIIVAIALWQTNFGGFRDTIENIWASLVTNLGTIFSGIGNIFSGVWNLITGIFEGNYTKIQKGFMQVGLGIVKILLGAFRLIQDISLNLINLVIMTAIDIITLPMKLAIDALADVMDFLGLSTKGIDKVRSALNAMRDYNPLEDLGINSVIQTQRGMEDKALQVAGDFIVNLDTAADADGFLTQLKDAIGKGA